MKFAFYSLGCKVNRFEAQALRRLAEARGHEIVEQDADVCIVNTCTVTSVSDHKNIRAFHRIRRDHPRAVVAACGCFAQVSPDKVMAQPEIDLICGTGDRAAILDKCERAACGEAVAQTRPEPPPRIFEPLPAGVPAGRTRALLKIQDGCDNFCSYCIIPYARGHVRSMSPDEVLRQARALAAEGVRELVLTGIEISSYGRDLVPAAALTPLIEAVCSAVPDLRVRLSSLEPRTADADFCARLSRLPNLMPHFHLSLQSGSDGVLRRMKRRYTAAEYAETAARVRAAFPGCSITTDLIVGFPGETEAEFAETLAFLHRLQFADVHVFPYSPRTGTVAAALPGQLPPGVKAARADAARAAARESAKRFLDGFVGRRLDVLLEHPVAEGIWSGHSPYHFQLAVETTAGEKNRMACVRVTGRGAHGLTAKEI